jgi:ubiquinol-cytochrome c reductase cytochrome b subunit
MSSITTPTTSSGRGKAKVAGVLDELDQRYHPAAGLRKQFNKVFPTHWSFMLGEVALYSFIVLLLTGIYLGLWFDPSMVETHYEGPFDNLRGLPMSTAYASALEISFEVRGGLFARQVHHWAALLFLASMFAHMFRIFFTGAFRKPREANWTIGIILILVGTFEGFTGYSLPDDLLSGTGARIASGITLSVPVVGTWLHWLLFGSEFPGNEVLQRLYTIHILLLPGILLALIAVHLGLVWYQKHTQFPGPGRTEGNVVGVRILPVFAAKGGAFFAIVVGVLGIMGGVFQINPIWNFGPYNPAQISAGSQPDFYMGWSDGMARLFPAWELVLGDYRIPATFWATAGFLPVIFLLAIAYPAIERRMTGDNALHNLLQRPRDVPVRTSLGAMAIAFYLVLLVSSANDWFAFYFDVSLNATTWMGRVGLLVLPPLAYWVTYRLCIGLQKADRAVLEHGVETGIVRRLPHGEFIEVHQPLAGSDAHGHPIPLAYQGAPVPKKMNQLGFGGTPVPGSLLTPDPADETVVLERARAEQARAEEAERAARLGEQPALESEDREVLAGRPDAGRPKDIAD